MSSRLLRSCCLLLVLLCVIGPGAGLALAGLSIVHDTSVIPPRASEALAMDPLSLFCACTPASERMNVGVRVKLSLNATGATADVQWTVGGSAIKAYTIGADLSIGKGYLTGCETSSLTATDLQQNSISFYYTEPGNSTITLDAKVDGIPETASIDFVVKRHPKAEIFYATGAGACSTVTTTIDEDNIIGRHWYWHKNVEHGPASMPKDCGQGDAAAGDDAPEGEFFRFHRGFIQMFNCWRGIFGYPCVKVYATAPNYIPTGDDFDHAGTSGDGNGIIDNERDGTHNNKIQELPRKFTIAGDGTTKLIDFSDEDALSSAIIGYHNVHHDSFLCHTGDFKFPTTTPADPIFWRFHFMLTKVYELWQFLQLDTDTITVMATSPSGANVYFADPVEVPTTDCSSPIAGPCTPPSGSLFPIGDTTVNCTVRDVMMLDPTFPGTAYAGTTKAVSFVVRVTGTVPAAFAAFDAVYKEEGVRLRWSTILADDVAGYNVYRSSSSESGDFVRINSRLIDAGAGNEYVDTEIRHGSTYWYRVGLVEAGEELLSRPISITIPGGRLALYPNVPNPFNPTTRISFYLPEASMVDLSVFDVEGRVVRTLVREHRSTGTHSVTWDGRNDQGHAVSTGIYLYRITAGAKTLARKAVLLK